MSDALAKAFSNSQRSLMSCKAAVSSQISDALLARGPGGIPGHRPDLAQSHEQLKHFRETVYSAVRPIATKIAGCKIHVGRTSTPGGLMTKTADVKPLESHPLVTLFADPNPLMVSHSLMFSTVASLELTGRSLWYVAKQKQIWPIPTSWIREIVGTSRIESFIIQTPYSAEQIPLDADSCVSFVYPSPSDPHGSTSPLQAIGGAVDSDESIVIAQASAFRRGLYPSHAILLGKNPVDGVPGGIRPRLSSAQQRSVINAVLKRYAGVEKAGEPVILDGLIESIQPLSRTIKEMDFLKSGEAARQRIFQGFGVSPVIAGLVEGSNRASSDAADRHFIDYCIGPKIELLSQTLTGWMRYVFNDQSLVVWIEKPVSNDAETSLRWAELLAKYGLATGDELRKLAPFELEDGRFPEPVAGSKPQPSDSNNDQLAQSLKMLDRSLTSLETLEKRFDPERIADGILDDIGGHDHDHDHGD